MSLPASGKGNPKSVPRIREGTSSQKHNWRLSGIIIVKTSMMNDGSPCHRSTLASYHAAKSDTETEQAQKSLRGENNEGSHDAAPTKMTPEKNDTSPSLDVARKANIGHIMPEGGAQKTSGDTEIDDDFDMSMIPMTFPQRLHEILSNEAHSSAISWLSHGKGFIIHKKKAFSEDVLPLYFKESKFTSFTRKLNRWGFTRVTRGNESGAYFHPFFQKGNLRRTLLMSCCQRKPPKKKASPGTHPNQGAPDSAALSASFNLASLGSILPAQLAGADQVASEGATRLLQQFEQAGSGLLLSQQQAQLEQVKTQLLLLHQQQQIAKLEEIRKGQQEELLSQLRGSSATADSLPSASSGAASGSSQLEAVTNQYQNLLELIKASSTKGNSSQSQHQQSLLSASLGASPAANNASSNSSTTRALEAAIAASLVLARPSAASSDQTQASPLNAAVAAALGGGASERSAAASDHIQASPLNAAVAAALGGAAGERTDQISGLLALLTAQQNAQTQIKALGQAVSTANQSAMSRAEQTRAHEALYTQNQQQQLNEFILQRALEATTSQKTSNAQEKTDK